MSQKSILEQALLQVQNLEDAVKVNAKGIPESTMKQELKDLLKESMEEEDELTTEADDDDVETNPDEEETDDMSDDTDETDVDDTDVEDDEETENDEDLDNETEDEYEGDEDSLDQEGEEDEPSMDDSDVMDMTGASHDEVLKVFKAMKPEDGIVVKKDGNQIEFNDGESDYIIKLDDEGDMDESWEHEMSENDEPFAKKPGKLKERGTSITMDENDEPFAKKVTGKLKAERGHSVTMDETDETVYEIELDDESGMEGDQNEAARTFGNGVRGSKQKTKYQAGRHEMNEEISKLRKQNAEYKKALVLFKDKLNEVAVFNANLAHMTRLFTEQTTTKKEKLNIIKRFDSISGINESKNLFTLIESELTDKKPISESVVEKISMTPTSSSTNVLSEAKAYENPQFKRMKDLMSKVK